MYYRQWHLSEIYPETYWSNLISIRTDIDKQPYRITIYETVVYIVYSHFSKGTYILLQFNHTLTFIHVNRRLS